MKKGLEKVIRGKVKPIIDNATIKTLGITSPEINVDITDQLLKSPLLDMPLDTTMKFKDAKKEFKKFYIKKLLHLNFGNISQVAKIAGVDRRSIHRLAKEFKFNIDKIRGEMLRAEYVKESKVADILEDTIDTYKSTFNAEKIKELVEYLPKLSKDIVKELPDELITLKEAEEEFEKRFILHVLQENKGNISRTAREIGLRFETLHRKLKQLNRG
tara:strand:+ start:1013 stop:1657 length:645 start_codon:yes stop_codon:yes gene_type:complete